MNVRIYLYTVVVTTTSFGIACFIMFGTLWLIQRPISVVKVMALALPVSIIGPVTFLWAVKKAQRGDR